VVDHAPCGHSAGEAVRILDAAMEGA
jgi:hypothetical protein